MAILAQGIKIHAQGVLILQQRFPSLLYCTAYSYMTKVSTVLAFICHSFIIAQEELCTHYTGWLQPAVRGFESRHYLGMAGPLDVRIPDTNQVVTLLHTTNLKNIRVT